LSQCEGQGLGLGLEVRLLALEDAHQCLATARVAGDRGGDLG
jgi:hypothetical protein